MDRYDHGGDIYGNRGVKLDFSVNTNPFGLPAAVREMLANRVDEFSHYPDPLCRELRTAIATHESIPEEWILCGNGAADLIYRLCYAIQPRHALVCAPTFSEYERALEFVGCRVSHHLLEADQGFLLTSQFLEKLNSDIDMVFLCQPNNPTGRLISHDLLRRIYERARRQGIIVVVDECFLDFTDVLSSKRNLKDMPHLIVLKAFTKIYAMAGLRLGYLMMSDTLLLDKINAAAQCWSVSVPAQIAGVAALTCKDWLRKTRDLVASERHYLSQHLEKLGITVFPSDANYLLFRSDKALIAPLLQKGIMIRSCQNFHGLDSTYYRIGIKTRAENSLFIQSVKELMHG